jgi:hypothetical protein
MVNITKITCQILLASVAVMAAVGEASAQSPTQVPCQGIECYSDHKPTVAGNGTGAGSMEGGLAAEKRGDWKAAYLLLIPLAAQGNPVAQFHIGYMLEVGKVDTTDAALPALGFRAPDYWYRLSALQGNAQAQVNYGKMQKRVIDDRLLAAARYGRSTIGLDEAYLEGVIPWFRKSADQGNLDGQYQLGAMYYEGKGVDRDYAEAVKWLRKPADQGNVDGQRLLGYIYYNGGEGVPRDSAEAVKWFKKAADQGDEDGKKGYAAGKKALAILLIIKPQLAAKKDVGQTVCLPPDDPLLPPSASSAYGQVEQVHNDKIEVRRHNGRNPDQLDWINYNAVFVCD